MNKHITLRANRRRSNIINIIPTGGKLRIPKSTPVGGTKNKTNKDKRRKNKKNVVRGKEVTIREAAADWQVIYGKMRVGGVTTFVETSSNSHAYIVTGSSNSQVAWTARTGGATGNEITVRIILSGTQPTLLCNVSGTDITITLKSTSGVSESTAAQVIQKVRDTAAAHALVAVNIGDGDGTGNMAAFAEAPLVGGGGTWLYQYITIAGHEIDAIEKLYLDEREVTFGASPDPRWAVDAFSERVFMAVQKGADSQEAQPDLMAQLPSTWTEDHRQRGCAGVTLILVWNQNTFAEGLPEISFLVRGKKVYDPRTGLTTYSQNAALIVADFLTNTRYGLGIPYASLDEATLEEAADRCEDNISLAGGGTEDRYLINGVFDTSRSKDDTLEELLAAMAGDLVIQGGKYYIYPGVYRTPTITLTEDDLREGITIKTHVSRSDSFNSIRGTYVDPNSNYLEADIPPVKNSTYITEDGGVEKYEDVALNFVTASCQAQRLLKIELERNRQGIEVVFPAKLTAFNVKACDTINISLPEFGWSPKIFEVVNDSFVLDNSGAIGFDLTLRETASAIFDWNTGLETTVDIAPNTTLPDPSDVEEPQNLTLTSGTTELYIRNDGTVHSRLKVSWDASVEQFVFVGGTIEIQYKRSISSTWSNSFTVPGYVEFHHILDVQDGVEYDVRIRAVNTIGYASDWVTETNHEVEGKSAPPSDVTGFQASITDDGILLTWDAIADTDRSEYEIRTGASWAAGTVVARVKSSDGTAFVYQYRTAGSLTLRIKAIDTSGNYSTNDATAAVTITGPNPVNNLAVKTVGTSVLLDWNDPSLTTFSVIEYDVYKGDNFSSASKLGTVFGTFHTYVERLGGNFTYWVVAIDTGGNRSSEESVQATITPPDDYFIQSNQNPLLEYTVYNNCIIGGSDMAPDEPNDSVWLPVPLTMASSTGLWLMLLSGGSDETFEEWWDTNGWNTLQDAIDAGYTYWLEPGTTTPGYLEMLIDFGTVFSSSFVDWEWIETVLGEPTTIVPTISVSEDDITYTDYVGATQVFVTDFRYVRLRLDFTGSSEFSLSRLSDMSLTISLQREEETGIVEVLAADEPTDGTVVVFTKDFLDVEDIQLTADGIGPQYPVLNFDDIPDPVSFQILLYDEDGTPIDGFVRYRVRGAVNP